MLPAFFHFLAAYLVRTFAILILSLTNYLHPCISSNIDLSSSLSF
nr:MAG TPA: hypothetical protein [Caudoviricetes sp.]